MQVATFNCNSVRRRLDVILHWLAVHNPDVLALQETKVQDHDFPEDAFLDAGWNVYFRGQKAYNGVAMITRDPVEYVSFGLQDDDGESASRLAHVTCGETAIVNTYVPQGSELGSPKFAFKLEWFTRLRRYFTERFEPTRDRVLWIGDLNVAPTPADVYDSQKVWPHLCHCQEVIDAFRAVTDWGFHDIFRKHLPESGRFTFWDYRLRNAVENGLGWRIDHVLGTQSMTDASVSCDIDVESRLQKGSSDHTFVTASFR
ncbi:MAG: exodeoxyribonuclease III [Candidatus Pacebacteria bacterium]|nr:exodeoxyribonuclease III [Candidatus Paceibacterota bacterium]